MDAEIESKFPEVKFMITCSLCHNILFEPRTLPCQHSFCCRCLSAWTKNSTYSNRGLECPTCQNKFPSMTLEDLRIDMKVLMLQKMAGVHTFDTATPPTSGRLTNGDSKSTGGRNHLQGVEDDFIEIGDTNGSNLQSGIRIQGLGDDSDSSYLGEPTGEAYVDSDLSSLDEMDGAANVYLTSESDSDPEQDEKLLEISKLEVVHKLFDDEDLDTSQFDKIFLDKPIIRKCVDIKHKKEQKEPFVHDLSLTRDGNLFVVDINNNVVKCCDSEGLILKKSPKKLTFRPIRLCELYTGEMLVVEMNKFGRGKITQVQRSLADKESSNKDVLRSLKKICVVRQMPEDRKRFYCGDSDGFVHRVNLRSPEAYLKFHSVLPRVYHMATANSTIAVNDGNLRGNTSKIVRIFDEQGDLKWSYSGTQKHPFIYHGDMVFHGDYLLVCDFWASKIHALFVPGEMPARVIDLKQDIGLRFPSSVTTTVDHKLVMAAQKAGEKKSFIFTLEYLA
ncbi:uncharacterized protein LOC134845874 [Symsagittifera roscoffensis]|uniref:uncharacterized protein LOC134845874 n=1 Tax=Symsagittifera roscoffensis TaxID=84072 RepID=UPI00307B1F88